MTRLLLALLLCASSVGANAGGYQWRGRERSAAEVARMEHWCPTDCGCEFNTYRYKWGGKAGGCYDAAGNLACWSMGSRNETDVHSTIPTSARVHEPRWCRCRIGYETCRMLKWQGARRLEDHTR
jgi:hypothetical protein